MQSNTTESPEKGNKNGIKIKSRITERIEAFNLLTMEEKKVSGDLITPLKFLNQLDEVDYEKLFERSNKRTRDHSTKLSKQLLRKDVKKYFYCIRVVDNWNKLYCETVNVDKIHQFK